MMVFEIDCRSDRIVAFLEGRLNEQSLAEFETHLESCPNCREQLERVSATPENWSDIHDSLSQFDPHSVGHQHSRLETITTYDLTQIRSLLGPSDDPKMLGRIDSYEIVGIVGRGGMGIVFKGLDVVLNRVVAIKMMSPTLMASGESSGVARQRFLREARAAAAVAHEHVVSIHGVAECQGMPYLVMEFVRGASLDKRLADEGRLSLRECLRIGAQIAAGLAAAHAQGLIHRDLKPANVMLETGIDRVRLTDFGLARSIDDLRLTRTDTLAGTPQYMSPEQVRDEPLDYRSDLFSLGAVLYEASTGRLPFHAATSYGVIRKIVEHQPPAVLALNPDMPEWFSRLVTRLLAKRPVDRFSSAAEVAGILQAFMAHVEHPHTVPLPPLEPAEASKNHNSRSLLKRSLIMSAVALSVLIGFVALNSLPDAAPPAFTPNGELRVSKQSTVSPDAGSIVTSAVPKENADESNKAAVAQVDPTKANPTNTSPTYNSAEEAYRVGVAFHNSMNYKASREPFEAALKLAKDDEFRLKVYEALIPAYRDIPEFEPFQTAAEFIITHSSRDTQQSLTRRAFLSFAYNRGQLDNLAKRYEERLSKNSGDRTAVYILSELYSATNKNPKRAIELIQQLEKLDSKSGSKTPADPKQATKIAREKANLASQYVKSKEFRKAAELYEEIAPLDPNTHAWNLKEAAQAWLKDGNKEKALKAALAADQQAPEARNDQLAHFFHRNLGDVFVAVEQHDKAVPHYKIALEKTTIEGYRKDTKAALDAALERSKSK